MPTDLNCKPVSPPEMLERRWPSRSGRSCSCSSWPLIAWSRLPHLVLPYSRWPAELEAKLEPGSTETGGTESAWLDEHCQPAEPLPVSARIAFAAAVVVSAPAWWDFVRAYAAMVLSRS